MVERPTLKDLALAAGVSIATVDRVINRRVPVTGDTAQRIVKAAKLIGYHATSLIKRRIAETPIRMIWIFTPEERRILPEPWS